MRNGPEGHLWHGFMELALAQARAAAVAGEVPVGAVLVDGASGEVLAQAANATIARRDTTAHAELLAMQAAAPGRGGRLDGCDLYVTLEPCAMCAGAIAWMRIRRLYFGAEDEKGGAVMHGPRFFTQPTCHWRPEIYGGIGADAAAGLLRSFFRNRR